MRLREIHPGVNGFFFNLTTHMLAGRGDDMSGVGLDESVVDMGRGDESEVGSGLGEMLSEHGGVQKSSRVDDGSSVDAMGIGIHRAYLKRHAHLDAGCQCGCAVVLVQEDN